MNPKKVPEERVSQDKYQRETYPGYTYMEFSGNLTRQYYHTVGQTRRRLCLRGRSRIDIVRVGIVQYTIHHLRFMDAVWNAVYAYICMLRSKVVHEYACSIGITYSSTVSAVWNAIHLSAPLQCLQILY